MPKPVFVKTLSIVVGAGVVLCLLGWGAGYELTSMAFHGDYSKEDPKAVFQDVVGIPVPDGVTDIRVSGRKYFTKAWVFMRFHATDEALKKFANDSNKYSQTDFETLKKGPIWAANRRYNDIDMQAVGWDQVRTIRRPQLYMAGYVQPDYTKYHWFGEFIVDPDTHLIYVDVGGD